MTEKRFIADPSPWTPMTDLVDLKHLNKLNEELAECIAATSRCLMQGIDECEPSTGKPNRQWLQEEIADVLANIDLVIQRFDLDLDAIECRVRFKMDHLRRWHAMGSAYQGLQHDHH